ncbi:hypothetical protein FACS1894191_0680 [Clostridia bacterium]|nr:hypothetical protein FACS1894191_0680 [Clostridia bacterium]
MSNSKKIVPEAENEAIQALSGQDLVSNPAPKHKKKPDEDNWRYHNTKKLLQKYRAAKMSISAALDELEEDYMGELGTKFTSLEEMAQYLDVDLSGTYLASWMRSMQRNKLMLSFINRAIRSMRRYDRNGEEFYWILYFKYMAPNEEKCANDAEIVTKMRNLNIPITSSTYYRRLSAAVSTLSGILWGYTSRDTLSITELFLGMKEG